MKTIKKAWINAVFLVATLVVNTLGGMGVINGMSQKDVSDMFSTLITPSPFAFSIWGLIYSLLIIAVIVMINKTKKGDKYYQGAVNEISVLFWISCILNIVWIIAFSYLLIELSVVFILGFAVTLALICQRLLKVNDGKHWLLPLTFGIYAGWLFIATVVNVAVMLVKIEWNGFGLPEEIWATIILIVSIILVLLVLFRIRNAAFPLPIAWAYFGIYHSLRSPMGFNGQFILPQNTALVGMIVLIIIAAVQFYLNRFWVIPKIKCEN